MHNQHRAVGLHPFVQYIVEALPKNQFIEGAHGLVRDWQVDDLRAIAAIYYGMISEVDTQLGRVFEHLRSVDAWRNTVIVFTSDHGEMMGDHGLLGKHGFFDSSYHIPLIIRDPSRQTNAGQVVEHFTEAIDIAASLMDWVVEPKPPQLDGHSLLPFLVNETPKHWRTAAHWEFDFRNIQTHRAESQFELLSQQCNLCVIRDQNYKYVHFAGLPPLLFDLQNDPSETTNLVNSPDYVNVRLQYAEALLSWRAEHLDQTLALSMLTPAGYLHGQSAK